MGARRPSGSRPCKKRFGRPVMKAIGVATAADLGAAERYVAVADRLLLDAKPPKGAARPGGNGAPFDWTLLAGFDPDIPWLLSGGLDAGQCRRGRRASPVRPASTSPRASRARPAARRPI